MTVEQTLRALTELVHAMRPTWDRAGIYAALHSAYATRSMDQLAHVAIDAATDKTAKTPAVIGTRDRHWQPTLRGNDPPPAANILNDQRPAPDVTRRGAALARHALANPPARVDDNPDTQPPPRDNQ